MAKHIQTIRRQIAALLILRLKGSGFKSLAQYFKASTGCFGSVF